MADTNKTKSNNKSYGTGSILLGNIKSNIKEWSAAEAAWWTGSTKASNKTRGNSILPSFITDKIKAQGSQKKETVNQSTKYPWLTIEEETQIDSNPALSNIARERAYKDMLWKKEERTWLDDRSNIRKQYISKQATTGNEDDDRTLINMWQALDWVREEIIKAWGRGVNKVSDMELVNMIWETNPYTAKIINSVSKWNITPEQATYFLLNWDWYKEAVDEFAKENPAWQKKSWKKEKVWFLWSMVEWAFSTVKWTAKSLAKMWIDGVTKYNPMILPARWISYLVSWEDQYGKIWDKAKDIIEQATTQWDETATWNKKYNKLGYWVWKLIWEAWQMAAAGWLSKPALAAARYDLGTQVGTKLAASKYAPQVAKGIEILDKIWKTWWGKAGKWVLDRALNWVQEWLTIQWVSDLVEWDLSSAKDYMSSIELATVLWWLWDFIWLWFKKFANPWKKISEIVEGEGWLRGNQINQIEKEVKLFNSTNKAESPFRTRANEVKTQAIPKIDEKIKVASNERDALTKNMVNDWNKSTYDYLNELNTTLKNSDLGNINIVKWKNGKWKVSWGTTAGSEAEKQLKEFVDMINAQSDWGTKSLIDTIKAAKQIAKEAKIAWKSTKITKAITDYSQELEGKVKELYPDIWKKVSDKNTELSELLWTKSKIMDLWDDYSSLAGKMNSDTDFYNFMEDLYKNWYTTEHMGNKTLWTYYTLWLRAPELLSEQAKLFYPSVPWLEEAWLRYLQKQVKQTYWWLWALAGEDVTTPIWAWSKMAADVWQLRAANNR